jgi:SAM-dependent methyltransferase
MNALPQRDCLVCGGPTEPLLDLDMQPLANVLLRDGTEGFDTYPLGLATCPACSHAQLTHFLPPGVLFSDYLYASGTSTTLRQYFQWFAAGLAACLPAGARVLEIASNDGSLLTQMAAEGFDVTGVDPAANLNAVAAAAGHRVLTGFFPEAKPQGHFDAVVAMNVTAHTPQPLAFLRGVADILAPGGVAILQTSQALMLANGEFDTIYHEHYSFFTVASMRRLAERAGLRLEQVRLVSVHGTSFLFFLRRADDAASPLVFPAQAPFAVAWPEPVPAYLALHPAPGAVRAAYADFAAKAKSTMQGVASRLSWHKARGRQVALAGVAAKALTFVRAAGIEPDLYLDEAPLKIGRLVPGSHAPIAPLTAIAGLQRDTVFLIGAWNFADELIRKIRAIEHGFEATFLIHYPHIREVA